MPVRILRAAGEWDDFVGRNSVMAWSSQRTVQEVATREYLILVMSQATTKQETSKEFWDRVRARIALHTTQRKSHKYARLAKKHRDIKTLVGLAVPLAPLVTNETERPSVTGKRNKLAAQQDNKCAYCGSQFDKLRPPTFDHIKPRSRGGTNHVDNLVAACSPCNQLKGNMASFEEAKAKAELYLAFAAMLKEKGYLR